VACRLAALCRDCQRFISAMAQMAEAVEKRGRHARPHPSHQKRKPTPVISWLREKLSW
jgi:hypothetical protein